MCYIPNGYVHMHHLTFKTHKKAHALLAEVKQRGNRYRGRLNLLNKLILGTLAGKFPHVSNVVMEQIIHIGAVLYSSELGLCDVIDDKTIIEFVGVTGTLPISNISK